MDEDEDDEPEVTKVQGAVNCLVPLLCCIFELASIITVISEHDSICIQAHEISTYAVAFLLLISTIVVPDLVFCLTIILAGLKITVRPFCLIYHPFAVFICMLAALILGVGITDCGNAAQGSFYIAVVLALVAAVLHLIFIYLCLRQIQYQDDDESD